jgi:hypothetical protein
MSSKSFNIFSLIAAAALLVSVTAQRVQAAPLTWTPLTLFTGWFPYTFDTRAPAAAIDPNNNIVHLRGAILSGQGLSATRAFRLPATMRPAGDVFIPVDTCEATYGRIVILKNGNAFIGGTQDAIECFVSLEGVTFPRDGAGVPGEQ